VRGIVPTVRELRATHHIHTKKRLGQSFLEDNHAIQKIVSLAGPLQDQTIVEIGAGLGNMTEELAKQAGRVIALEIDLRLLDVLRKRFSSKNRVEVLDQDVLKYDFSQADRDKKITVVGNIPYYLSSPLLFRLVSYRRYISSCILTFQKEFAERITAHAGTRQYGIPSVIVAKYMDVSCELVIPPEAFYPRPEVSSCVVRMTVKKTADDPHEKLFERVVRGAFAHRRKNLLNNLIYMGFSKDLLDAVFFKSRIDSDRRAQTLTLEEFANLTHTLAEATQQSP